MTKFGAVGGMLALLVLANAAAGAALSISSPMQRATLIELYTSEGCSSCPPADRWLSRFKNAPRLWKDVVPVAFHVDYWDYLGWRDRFARARFSQRQDAYQKLGYLGTVYTPGVVKNGREWRGWVYGGTTASHQENAGVVKVEIADGNVAARFAPPRHSHEPLVLNAALLGFDLPTQVGAGENAGKVLNHDFVVMKFAQTADAPHDREYHWKMPGFARDAPAGVSGIAVWVSAVDDPTPLQATGGWLK